MVLAVAVDLPGDDEHAGLSAYADRVIDAIGARDVILVVQSLAGFTAPLVCARVRVRMLVFVNAMIPVPGETAGQWWENTGSTAARTAAAQRGGYTVVANSVGVGAGPLEQVCTRGVEPVVDRAAGIDRDVVERR